MTKRLIKTLAVGFGALLAFASQAFASAAYPLTSVSTGFTDQVGNAVTTALPIAGPILALFVGWRVMKRIVKA
jgi:hypothetical protein